MVVPEPPSTSGTNLLTSLRLAVHGCLGLHQPILGIPPMASAHDVAALILEQRGRMTTLKLQKLVYYCQAWHLVWEDRELFPERVEAWANGPVVPEIFAGHRGLFEVSAWTSGASSNLAIDEVESIDAVLDTYGDKSGQWLAELTHREDPWRLARGTRAPGERSSAPITPAAMVEYYSSLI